MGLLISIVNAFTHIKCISLSNQKCMTQPTVINLHPNEYSQEFHYYPFSVKLYRCVGSCNTLNDLSNKVFVPSKTEDLNLTMFNIFGRNLDQSPSNLNFRTFSVTSKHFYNHNKNIKQVSCVKVPNLVLLCKHYFAYLV